jgi:hypothetical protein
MGVILTAISISAHVSAAEPRLGRAEASLRHDDSARALSLRPAERRDGTSTVAPARADSSCDAEDDDSVEGKRKGLGRKQTRELLIAGGTLTGLGVVGIAIGVAGMTIGAQKQKEADSKILPAEQRELDQLDKEGARANQMGVAGLAVGGGLLARRAFV